MTTRDRILELLQANPRTPLGLVRELEMECHARRDARSTLLRLISDGTVDFDVDGKIRLPKDAVAHPSAATAAHA